MSSGLAAACLASLIAHLMGLTALAVVGGALWSPPAPEKLIPTELIVAPPAPAITEPPPEPDPLPVAETVEEAEPLPAPFPPVTPPKLEQIMPPKLVEKPLPTRVESRPKPPPPVTRLRLKEPASPPMPPASPRPGLPLPAASQAVAGNALGAPAERPADTAPVQPAEGGAAGAGKLFEQGDMGVVPGAGAGGGSAAPGRAGLGTGGPGAGGTRVAGLQPGAGGTGSGGADGLARPLGGYQVKPRYPESMRRQGIAGTTLLKVYVSDKGLVDEVLVERSAGHRDLDLAAMEAVTRWRFEPARQGNQPIAIWVMLPVRFELR